MKKVILLVSVILLATGLAFAEAKKKPAAVQQPAVTKTTMQNQAASLGKIIAQKKTELNGKEWNIELKPMVASGKAKVEADVISFAEDKVTSKNSAALGHPATNFSVRLEEDGTVIWETMQVSEKDGTAFWRGDIGPDGVMRGVLSKRDIKGNVKDFNFASVAK